MENWKKERTLRRKAIDYDNDGSGAEGAVWPEDEGDDIYEFGNGESVYDEGAEIRIVEVYFVEEI